MGGGGGGGGGEAVGGRSAITIRTSEIPASCMRVTGVRCQSGIFLDRSGKESSGEENLKDFNNLMKEMEYVYITLLLDWIALSLVFQRSLVRIPLWPGKFFSLPSVAYTRSSITIS